MIDHPNRSGIIKFYLSLALLGLLPSPIYSQSIKFENFSSEQGLSTSSVTAICQDSAGYMWIGTSAGLDRYDGSTFEPLKQELNDPYSVNNNAIHILFKDQKGRMWVGTEGVGIQQYDLPNHRFITFSTTVEEGKESGPSWINSVAEAEDHSLWIGTKSQGIFHLFPEDTLFEQYSLKELRQMGASIDNIESLAIGPHGNIWLGSSSNGLVIFNPTDQKTLSYHQEDDSGLMNNSIRYIYPDSKGNMWLSTLNGLYQAEDVLSQEIDQLKFKAFGKNLGQDVGFKHLQFDPILEDDDFFWIGTLDGGLYKFYPEYDQAISYHHEITDPKSLLSDVVWAVFRDEFGVLWVGTDDGGVSRFDPKTEAFNYVRPSTLPNVNTTSDVIRSITDDQTGNIWIGTDKAGIIRYNPRTGDSKHFTEEDGLLDIRIRSMAETHGGNIWAGTPSALYRYRPSTQQFEQFLVSPDMPLEHPSNYVRHIEKGPDGHLYLILRNSQIIRYNYLTDEFERSPYDKIIQLEDFQRAIRGENINIIYGGFKGILYVNDTYVAFFDWNTQHLQKYQFQMLSDSNTYVWDKTKHLLLQNEFTTHDKWADDSTLWVGTKDHGLAKLVFDPPPGKGAIHNTGTVKRKNYLKEDGLNSNFVYGIQLDFRGNVWVSTTNGISHIFTKTDSIDNYYSWDGLQSNDFNWDAAYASEHRPNLYFGGMRGLNYFHPDSIRHNQTYPKVSITGLQVYNKAVPVVSRGDSISKGMFYLEKSISELDEVIFTHKERVISLEFAALHFSNPDNNVYAYQLVGVDEDWVQKKGPTGTVTYTNLEPGSYTFRVKAANSSGLWNPKAAELAIEVLPAPWRSAWAYLIYALIFIEIMVFIYQALLQRERLKNDLQFQTIRSKQLHEIDQVKNRFFANISHEFRTPLTLIISPIDKLKSILEQGKMKPLDEETFEKGNQILSLVDRNGNRLLGLINQLLDLTKLDSGKMKLEATKNEFVQFSRMMAASFHSLGEQKKLEVLYDYDIDQLEVWFDKEKMEKILLNLLSNAYKFTPENGRIIIRLDKLNGKISKQEGFFPSEAYQSFLPDQEFVSWSISNTGAEISKNDQARIFERFFQATGANSYDFEGTGIGLSLVKELVFLHRGAIHLESGKGNGTTFSLYFPLGETHLNQEEIHFTETPLHQNLISDNNGFSNPLNLHPQNGINENPYKGKARILVVEDNEDVRQYIRLQLEEEYHLEEAVDGLIGVERANEEFPDLIISDVMMPGMNGYELCQSLKLNTSTNHIPIILLTAKANVESRIEGIEIGADAYIAKPFHPKELKAQIENLLLQRQKLQEHYSKKLMDIKPDALSVSSVDESFLLKVKGILEAKYSDHEFNVNRFADEMAISRKHLNRKLKSLTGKSPIDWIRNYRLEKAEQLLHQKHGSVSDIAFKVGFNNLSHFSQSFSEYFGKLPSDLLK